MMPNLLSIKFQRLFRIKLVRTHNKDFRKSRDRQYTISVDSLCRDREVGTQLMAKFEQIAEQHECILISLATSGAKGFYEKLGYISKAAYYKKYLH